MNFRASLALGLMIIISSGLIYPQYLEQYDKFFINKEKRALLLKLAVKTEINTEKHINTKTSDTSVVIHKFYYDQEGNLTQYEFFNDALGLMPAYGCEFITDDVSNTLKVFVKGKLTASQEYDSEGNKILEIMINVELTDTVEHCEYNYTTINDEKLLTSISVLHSNSSIGNCTKYIFDYDSLGRIVYRRDFWSNGNLSMEKHWDYDSFKGYTKSLSIDGEHPSSNLFTFDKDGRILLEQSYVPEFNAMEISGYIYDKEGHLIWYINILQDQFYKGEMKYDNNGHILESKLFENDLLKSFQTSSYYNNELLKEVIFEDYGQERKTIFNYGYEFY
jgi:hypothetical protein